MNILQNMLVILSLIFSLLGELASSSTNDPHYVGYNCGSDDYSYSPNSAFQQNLNHTLFTQLVANASYASFSTFNMGRGIDQVYAFYYCRADMDPQVCHDCVTEAATKVLGVCKFLKQAIVWYEECTLRYANKTIFTSDGEDLSLRYPKYNSTTPDLGDYLEKYWVVFNSTMTYLIDQAANNVSLKLKGFATTRVNLSSSQSLRGIVQCAPIISGASCEECLNAAFEQMAHVWTNTMEFLPTCFVGFELYGSRPPLPPLISSSTLSVGNRVLIGLLCPVAILSLLAGIWLWKRKHPCSKEKQSVEDNAEVSESGKQHGLAQFSYYQVEEMTRGFSKKLGEGGFAVVYHGCLSDGSTEIAVKVFSEKEAPNQFSTEINVLGGISHKNLVSLIGYCEDGTVLALIYEYMARGDLRCFLSEHSDDLSWRKRVEIAIDIAQGLDYLHNGCSPAIVHRDVKPANILLNNNLRAKVADFGFSKIFPAEYVSNLQTRVVGTPGYLDPQYSLTGQLNEKGDVYSYGIVLLELITGKSAILNTVINLGQWVKSMLERGDIVSILDSRLRQDINDDYVTVWKTVELGVRCIQLEGAERPTMAQIVTELKECWTMMSTQTSSSARNSTERMSGAVLSSSAVMSPSPR